MLHKISIENFFSIAEKQEIDFEIAHNAPDLLCFKQPPSNKDTRLPAVVGFFGPNASGKSTILRAISSLMLFSCHSFDWNNNAKFFFQPYRQKDWWGKPTKILIEFDAKLNEDHVFTIFRYELHIAHKEKDFDNKIVSYEKLSYAPKGKFRCLFERDHQEFHFGTEFGIPNTPDPRKESIRPDASTISTLVKLNHPLSIYLKQQIENVQTNVVSLYKPQQSINQILLHYAQNKPCLDHLNKELKRFDLGLESMAIEQQGDKFVAKLKHVGLDDFIFLSEESRGTQCFIQGFPALYYALEKGSVVIVDEIDNDLHPLLLPELLRWFADKKRNPNDAQLFFSAHNPAILNDLEKEQVFFTEKPYGQATLVYGARDIKGLRREPSLMKKYLSGELGAVPRIG